MKVRDILIRIAKKIYQTANQTNFEPIKSIEDRESANTIIAGLLHSSSPCLISRFGTVELNCVNNYLVVTDKNQSYIKKIWNYITDNTHTPWWSEDHFKHMKINAGIFPSSKETAERFAQHYLEDIPEIDILGSFQYYEKFMPLAANCQLIHLETLYPFFVKNPWTKALEGKKILVIHPFEETIRSQYKKRKKLFDNPNILPDFELITLKAIQSAAGISVPFKDWFEALNYMKNQIADIDFDICVLGCGAYGLPLAAFIKRMGKKAIHLGGGTQLLFGIKGKRWDDPNYGYQYNKPELMKISYASLYNQNWTKPLEADTPKTAFKIENACYW